MLIIKLYLFLSLKSTEKKKPNFLKIIVYFETYD
jgi:hypothetical protein